jgi:heat shock protein beta
MFHKILDLLTATARDSPETYSNIFSRVGIALKMGVVDDHKNRPKLVKLLRFTSSVDDSVSLDDYVARRKKGQKQIFFVAGIGASKAELEKSVFVEKALARGYEVRERYHFCVMRFR